MTDKYIFSINTKEGSVIVPLSAECSDQMNVEDGGVAHIRLIRATIDDPPERERMAEKRRLARIQEMLKDPVLAEWVKPRPHKIQDQ